MMHLIYTILCLAEIVAKKMGLDQISIEINNFTLGKLQHKVHMFKILKNNSYNIFTLCLYLIIDDNLIQHVFCFYSLFFTLSTLSHDPGLLT